MTQYVKCRECQIIYDVDDPSLEGGTLCVCGSAGLDPFPAKPACQTCNSNGVLVLLGGEALDMAVDWMQCPDCHGRGWKE